MTIDNTYNIIYNLIVSAKRKQCIKQERIVKELLKM